MRTVGAYEAKTHLAQLLDEVERGDTVTITRLGAPVAMLVPTDEARRRNARDAVENLRRLRAGVTLGGLSLREMIEEGRRY